MVIVPKNSGSQRNRAPNKTLIINPEVKNQNYSQDKVMDLKFHVLLLALSAIGIASALYSASLQDTRAAVGQIIVALTALVIGTSVGSATEILFRNRPYTMAPTIIEAGRVLAKSAATRLGGMLGIVFGLALLAFNQGDVTDMARGLIVPWILYLVAIIAAWWKIRNAPSDLPKSKAQKRP